MWCTNCDKDCSAEGRGGMVEKNRGVSLGLAGNVLGAFLFFFVIKQNVLSILVFFVIK